MADTATYDLIASQTLASAASSITFSSIAASWTDLRIVFNVTAVSTDNLYVRYNGDTASNYSITELWGGNASTGSLTTSNATFLYITDKGSITTTPALYAFDIFSYAGSAYKTTLWNIANDRNGSGYSTLGVGLWRSTSAITSVNLYSPGGSNLAAGTTAQLYGIKAA